MNRCELLTTKTQEANVRVHAEENTHLSLPHGTDDCMFSFLVRLL